MTEKRELLPYEVWKERYAYREITDKEVTEAKFFHGIEDLRGVVEKANQEAYVKYLAQNWNQSNVLSSKDERMENDNK